MNAKKLDAVAGKKKLTKEVQEEMKYGYMEMASINLNMANEEIYTDTEAHNLLNNLYAE